MPALQSIPQNTREFQAMLSHDRMIQRAIDLHKDGYTICAVCESVAGRSKPILGAFTIISPRGDAYAVDVLAQSCTCVCHRRNQNCKHVKGAYRLGCRQAHAEMSACWNFRHTPRGFARYVEAERLLGALESARVVCQRRMALVAA